MTKVLRKCDINRTVKKLGDVFAMKLATAMGNVDALSSLDSPKKQAQCRAQLRKYKAAKPAMDRLLRIAQTPMSLNASLLAEAWDAIVDLAMEMDWSLERGVCSRAYEVIDELRTQYAVDSTAPSVYGDASCVF